MNEGWDRLSDSEYEVLLRLGPDPAARITFWIGLPVWTLMAILLSLVVPFLSGVSSILWVLALWYSWNLRSKGIIEVRSGELYVRTPLRTFCATWESIKKVEIQSHLTIHAFDGTKFRIPQYTSTPFTRIIANHSSMFSDREALETAIKESMNRVNHSTKPVAVDRTLWHYPSRAVLATAALVGCGVEALLLILNT
jgi:hypothetical protein